MREQQMERFEACLTELRAMADTPSLSGRTGDGSFYAWEGLRLLVSELQAAGDRFELEGDSAPARAAIERYLDTLSHFPGRPDGWLIQRLQGLLAELESDQARVDLIVTKEPLGIAGRWPADYLSVSPDHLRFHLKQRAR